MTAPRSYLDGRITVHHGDCMEALRSLPDCSVDSCVTDPPYALASIVKRFGKDGAAPARSNGATGVYQRASAGFMGKRWDTGEVVFNPEFWVEVWRVLKPGAHVLAMSGTRTYHRLACAIEDAGFEIRDQIGWAYGSGFPKSHDVSKGIDKAAGAEREVVGRKTGRAATPVQDIRGGSYAGGNGKNSAADCSAITAPATPEAQQWQGWGTALKPAWEPICLARKPLIGTVAANVERWGTGAINVDGCRVEAEKQTGWGGNAGLGYHGGCDPNGGDARPATGRWPANLIHDGSEEVLAGFPETGPSTTGVRDPNGTMGYHGGASGLPGIVSGHCDNGGSAARFFYTAKADSEDRLGSKHPTVKPIDLMRYLARLITPPKGLILDPFAGTGTTGEAAYYEGFSAVLIEREAEYIADIERRMGLILAGPDERRNTVLKALGKVEDAGPLFEGAGS